MTYVSKLHKLPDFILITWGNRTKNKNLREAIDQELEARYDTIREEIERYANESSF